jgi:hypothetical protein
MRLQPSSSSLLLLLIPICLLSASAQAQPRTSQLPVPPPMRFVARDDRSQLTTTNDAKARVRMTIDLSNARLARTEELTSQKQFEQAAEALGNYLGLVEDVRRYIGSLKVGRTNMQDLCRRLDIALRGQIPRLAVVRRSTPADYAGHIKEAEEFIRNTRTEALESFFGHSVFQDKPDSETKADNSKEPGQENKRP